MDRHRTLVVGAAGAITVTVANLVILALKERASIALIVFIVAAIALATYIASFALIDDLYGRAIWPHFAKRNLTGAWDMKLTNLEDNSTRTGRVEIRHTPSSLEIFGANYRPGVNGVYSTWSTILASFVDESTLIALYQVESTADSKPFKRGVLRLQVGMSHPKVMTGDFFDNAPSSDRGPVVLKRKARA